MKLVQFETYKNDDLVITSEMQSPTIEDAVIVYADILQSLATDLLKNVLNVEAIKNAQLARKTLSALELCYEVEVDDLNITHIIINI